MTTREEFLEIVAKYCDKSADELNDDMRFREDLGFDSLGFMTFLGDLEDTFDIEVSEDDALNITTVGEALDYLQSLLEES